MEEKGIQNNLNSSHRVKLTKDILLITKAKIVAATIELKSTKPAKNCFVSLEDERSLFFKSIRGF